MERCTRMSKITIPSILFMMLCATLTGCGGPSVPGLVPLSGVVTLDGKPLPHVTVKFVPMAEGTGANMVAIGVTNKEGEFAVKQLAGEEGCRACKCKVTIAEGPIPEKLREMGQDGAKKIKAFRGSLKNRPIPQNYQTILSTPLEFIISAEESSLELSLKR